MEVEAVVVEVEAEAETETLEELAAYTSQFTCISNLNRDRRSSQRFCLQGVALFVPTSWPCSTCATYNSEY